MIVLVWEITGLELQLSVAVAIPLAVALVSAEHSMVTLAGHDITGGVISLTVIVCMQLAVLLQASVALHVRVMM